MDALDEQAVLEAVTAAKPEVVHQLTALSGAGNVRRFDPEFLVTNRLRTEGLNHLLAGARAAGAARIVAQSFTGWTNQRSGGPVTTSRHRFRTGCLSGRGHRGQTAAAHSRLARLSAGR
jgi:hypothetical protein